MSRARDDLRLKRKRRKRNEEWAWAHWLGSGRRAMLMEDRGHTYRELWRAMGRRPSGTNHMR